MDHEILQLIMALPASLGFALFFHMRKNLLVPAMIGGFLSWGVYIICVHLLGGIFVPCLIASAVSALYAEILGRRFKAPSSIFFIVAVITLVPGRALFYTMSSAVRGDWAGCADFGMTTLLYAAAIAIGISVVWAIFEVLAEARDRRFWARFKHRGSRDASKTSE